MILREPAPVRIGLPRLAPNGASLVFTRQAHESAAPELMWMPTTVGASPREVTPFGVFGRFVDRPDAAPLLVVTVPGVEGATEAPESDTPPSEEEQLFDDLLSLDAGLTPGVLATVLGVQPILTLMLVERRANLLRLLGLLLALGGLTLVVLDSLLAARFSMKRWPSSALSGRTERPVTSATASSPSAQRIWSSAEGIGASVINSIMAASRKASASREMTSAPVSSRKGSATILPSISTSFCAWIGKACSR